MFDMAKTSILKKQSYKLYFVIAYNCFDNKENNSEEFSNIAMLCCAIFVPRGIPTWQ